jgi:hypothetical protein
MDIHDKFVYLEKFDIMEDRFQIKKLLKQRGKTFQWLADQLAVHRVNLSSSLKGNVSLGRLEKISELLEVRVVDLFIPAENEVAVRGYLEHDGQITKVNSIADVEAFLENIKTKD